MRSIGMDVHRSFAQVAILEDGSTTDVRIDLDHDAVVAFGQTLRPDDEVVLEATGNTAAIVRLRTPFVARVVIANPLQVIRSTIAGNEQLGLRLFRAVTLARG